MTCELLVKGKIARVAIILLGERRFGKAIQKSMLIYDQDAFRSSDDEGQCFESLHGAHTLRPLSLTPDKPEIHNSNMASLNFKTAAQLYNPIPLPISNSV